jgi:mycobactin lysine-N-oxygenase
MSEKPIRIAVIGGGPKAAAIASKAAYLKKKHKGLHVTIFERYEVGANWTGKHGYSTGESDLCTPAERDLGFPYASFYGKACDRFIYKNYSWGSFASSRKRDYSKWVDLGRNPPPHSVFAEYLSWSLRNADVRRIDVDKITDHGGRRWQIHGTDKKSGKQYKSRELFDGVVITGPGPSKKIKGSPSRGHPRLFDGTDFWLRLDRVHELLKQMRETPNLDSPPSVLVVGGGGTGAATLAWLVENGFPELRLKLLANQATIHGRADNPFENAVFSSEDIWASISKENRRKFNDRLTRGIVWDNVVDQIKRANILPIDGTASRVQTNTTPLSVEYTVDGTKSYAFGDFIIDATGFNAWWFTEMFPETEGFKRWTSKRKSSLRAGIGPYLNFEGKTWGHPILQVPNLAGDVGPGFTSLMSLGVLSDRILGRYIDPEQH